MMSTIVFTTTKSATHDISVDSAAPRKIPQASQSRTEALDPEVESPRAKKAIRQIKPEKSKHQSLSASAPLPFEVKPAQKAPAQIIQLAKRLNGSVINVDYDQKSGLPHMVTIIIPTHRQPEFLKALKRVGHFVAPSAQIGSENQPHVTFRIRLLGSSADINSN